MVFTDQYISGEVNSEKWSDLIMVIPQQIDSRDVCLRDKSPSNKSLMVSLSVLGSVAGPALTAPFENTKVFTPQQHCRKRAHSNQFK